MNAAELLLPDGRPSGVFFCEKCRLTSTSHDYSERCCRNYICSDCGKDTGGRTWLVCDDCRRKNDQTKEQQRFEKAQKVQESEYAGWVYDYTNDKFFDCIEDAIDYYCDDQDKPEYFWACKKIEFVQCCLDDIISSINDNAYEEFDSDDLHGLNELGAAINRFVDDNREVCSYEPDYTRAVIVEQGRVE